MVLREVTELSGKRTIDDLALFGGRPAFPEPLHVGRPTLGDRSALLARINDALDRRWYTNQGPFVAEFERRIERMLEVPHCIATCNGTIALELAIRACGMRDEVIVPAFTFVATAHALQWQGIRPVFVDIDPHTRTIDPVRVREAITPRTTGIIGVHLWGAVCDVDALQRIADAYSLPLLFDAAHAFGCTHRGTAVGNFGTAEVFSFHATKFVSAFEGGAVVTHDAELAARFRLMKNFGFAGYDDVVHVGTNGKMTEVSAAMGLTSLESLDDFLACNRRNTLEYGQALDAVPGLQFLRSDPQTSNQQYVIVEIDEGRFGLSRDRLQQLLWAENVLARRYFYPACHRMEPYRSQLPPESWQLPVTEALAARVLALPTGAAVEADEVRRVASLVRFAATHAPQIRSRLTAVAAAAV